MECPARSREEAAVLVDYCARRLDPERAAALARHLEGCKACRERLEAQQAVWQALDGWKPAPVAEDFDRRLYRKIQASERPAGWAALLWPWRAARFRPAFSLAVASVVALAALLIHAPGPVAAPPRPAQVETVDADRLERALDDVEMLRQLNAAPATEVHSL